MDSWMLACVCVYVCMLLVGVECRGVGVYIQWYFPPLPIGVLCTRVRKYGRMHVGLVGVQNWNSVQTCESKCECTYVFICVS